MTPSSPGRGPERCSADDVLRRVLPEPPTDEEPSPAPEHPPARPAGVDVRRQRQLDAMGAADRESW